jgi:heme-degrading monooxygenase HmoA
MVLEQFVVCVHPGQEMEFERAMEHALRTVMSRADGMRAWSLRRCVETPDRFQVELRWDSIEDHLVRYRQGPLAPEFRTIVTPFFAAVPEMCHFEECASGEAHAKVDLDGSAPM